MQYWTIQVFYCYFMKKKRSLSNKGLSSIHLNWDAVRSFIRDVEVKDKIPTEASIEAFEPKTNSIITEKKESSKEGSSVLIEKVFVDRNNLHNDESIKSSHDQPVDSVQEKKKENLIDIVETLESCANARKGLMIFPIARVHCMYDDKGETFWFTDQYVNLFDLPELRKYGNFVPKYSDVAIKLQTCDVGLSFQYDGLDRIKRPHTYNVSLENRSDLQNQRIEIAGDALTYQYRNIREFLNELRKNQEDIKDVENTINDLRKLVEDLKKDKNTAHQRTQITKSINEYQEKYRILTKQQEDLKNITIYIRKQGEMRYSRIVDPVQTRIMSQNRFDGKTVVINGGPGTGKTTTMIHRLAFLTDTFAINEDEKKNLNKYKLNSLQRKKLREAIKNHRDWMFFSPSQLLKEYLSEAMKKEGLTNTSKKVWNWRDYCRLILQENYHLLEMNGSNAPFRVCYLTDTLFYQNSDIIKVFTDFYLDELRSIKAHLPKINPDGKVYAWTSIALNIQKRFEDADTYDLAHFVSLFNTLESVYGNDSKAILRNRNDELSELANDICVLLDKHKDKKNDIEDIFDLTFEEQDELFEEEEIDDYEDTTDSLLSKIKNWVKPVSSSKSENNKLALEIQKWLKSFCYSKVNQETNLSDEQKLIAEILEPIIDENFGDKIQKIGELMIFEQFAQYTRGVRAIMLNGIPKRYKRFRSYLSMTKFKGCDLKLLRDIMQRKQGKELHHQEQSLLLGFINTLVKQIKTSTSANIRHEFVEAYEYVARPIIGIDEVTDFSICDIYAMQSLLTRDFNSLTLCGDMMQRMTSYGIKSWEELNGVVANPLVFEMNTSYRQSKKLLEVARQLSIDTLKETPNYKAFMKSNKVPDPLVFVDKNEYNKIEWISKRISEVYRAYGEQLPSIAIFVNDKGYIPRFMENLHETEFFTKNEIKVLDGTIKNSTSESHICVYPIDQVKGMEFDVVFFHNIDNSSTDTELLKRYIYVGVSRAAFFLGITLNEQDHEISKYFEKDKDWFKI